MRSLVIAGGRCDPPFLERQAVSGEWDFLICADSGLDACGKAGLLPDMVIGDFDSVDPVLLQSFQTKYPDRIRRFPSGKDETDTELALRCAMRMGAERVTILGGTGGRLDHLLANLQLLRLALDAGVDCHILDSHSRVRMIGDSLTIKKGGQFGDYVSLIPFTPCVEGLTLIGFSYELKDFTLLSGSTRGIGNVVRDEVARIEMRKGLLLVIEARDEGS